MGAEVQCCCRTSVVGEYVGCLCIAIGGEQLEAEFVCGEVELVLGQREDLAAKKMNGLGLKLWFEFGVRVRLGLGLGLGLG